MADLTINLHAIIADDVPVKSHSRGEELVVQRNGDNSEHHVIGEVISLLPTRQGTRNNSQ